MVELYTEGGDSRFISFSNADGKRWIMPAKGMGVAMCLYQPSSAKGRLAKRLLPMLWRIKSIRRAMHAETMFLTLKPEILSRLCLCLGVDKDRLQWSLFCGTPCVHQKPTMQIADGNEILGYAKFSDNADITALFVKEAEMLDWLGSKGVSGIPRCLFYGDTGNGATMFLQSTTKTPKSTANHSWTGLETGFLHHLHERTRCSMPLKDTDFFHDILFLKNATLPRETASTITDTADNIIRHYESQPTCDWSAYHGDFTPWNTYIEQGKLHAFDFEYARRSYPPHLDFFHFITQTAIFEQHLPPDAIISKLFAEHNSTARLLGIDNPAHLYRCYLLAIISQYLQREHGNIGTGLTAKIAFWCQLLKLLP